MAHLVQTSPTGARITQGTLLRHSVVSDATSEHAEARGENAPSNDGGSFESTQNSVAASEAAVPRWKDLGNLYNSIHPYPGAALIPTFGAL